MADFNLANDTIRAKYTDQIANFCYPFICDNIDLDDFFAHDALLYDSELLGKTYVWLDVNNPKNIIGMITLANDSIKTKIIPSSARNRIQRSINNEKRGINYPVVLIGRLGVASGYRGKGYRVGGQILEFVKDWFRSDDNKTGCRFIVVDAYNNPQTLHFYEANGFKMLYKSEEEERNFLELDHQDNLETRFMFFDLKNS